MPVIGPNMPRRPKRSLTTTGNVTVYGSKCMNVASSWPNKME